MRSFDQQFLQIPYMNTEFGQRSFSYCSTKILNEIPAIIKASATVATFKRRLKSYFLSQLAFNNTIRLCPPGTGNCQRAFDSRFLDTVRVINNHHHYHHHQPGCQHVASRNGTVSTGVLELLAMHVVWLFKLFRSSI